MIYMTPQSSSIAGKAAHWGVIVTPRRWGFEIDDGRLWCMDNDCFNLPPDLNAMYSALGKMERFRSTCKFVVVPDSVANAVETLWRFRQWSWRFRERGWPVAYVAQDGQEDMSLPHWDQFDALFIGGTTEWKLSTHADRLIRKAKDAGKWVHIGRVNSQRRIRHFQVIGADSVDGTSIAYSPDKHYARFERVLCQPPLFHLGEV